MKNFMKSYVEFMKDYAKVIFNWKSLLILLLLWPTAAFVFVYFAVIRKYNTARKED